MKGGGIDKCWGDVNMREAQFTLKNFLKTVKNTVSRCHLSTGGGEGLTPAPSWETTVERRGGGGCTNITG